MKKIYSVLTLTGFLFANNVVKAEDVKPYVGLSFYSNSTDVGGKKYDEAEEFLMSINAGIKQNINNDFFIGVEGNLNLIPLIDYTTSYSNGISYENIEINVHQLLNAKAIFGYNFTENFSVFGIAGIALNSYEFKDFGQIVGVSFSEGKKKNKIGTVFGLGTAYELNDKYQLTLSYEIAKFEIKEGTSSSEIESSNVKFSINYKF